MDTVFSKKTDDKSLGEASFAELVAEASRKATTDSAPKILATCPEIHARLLADLELTDFIQNYVIKHLETKLRVAKKLK